MMSVLSDEFSVLCPCPLSVEVGVSSDVVAVGGREVMEAGLESDTANDFLFDLVAENVDSEIVASVVGSEMVLTGPGSEMVI